MDTPKRHAFPSGKADQYIVRFPQGMRDTIKNRAEANRRSMNAEIIFCLEKVLATETQKADATAS